MEIFAVFKQGVYRHECCGIYDNKAVAIACADYFAENEEDQWHSFEVVPFKLNWRTPYGTRNYFGRTIQEKDAVYSARRKLDNTRSSRPYVFKKET